MAEIDCINNNWSSKGAAMDAFNRVEHDSPFIAMWIGKDGYPKWSKANLEFKDQAQIATYIEEMTTLWAREILNEVS